MAHRKLLIADSCDDFRYALAAALVQDHQILDCGTGPQALELLRDFRPDVLVLDLMLPGMDGISLLRAAVEEGICPAVLATVPFATEYIAKAADRLGIRYLLVKPCHIRGTADLVRDLRLPIHPPGVSPPDPPRAISRLLLLLGFSTKLRGYAYTREAILLLCDNPDQSMTKELYPSVAALCGTSPRQVEHCIRTAIEKAWQHRDNGIWSQYFPKDPSGTIPKPSNAVFLTRLANSMIFQKL